MNLDAASFISDPNVRLVLIIILVVSLLVILIDFMRRKLYNQFKEQTDNMAKKMLRLETPIILMIIIIGIQIIISKTMNDYIELQGTINKIIGAIIVIVVTYMLSLIADLILEKWSTHLGKTKGRGSYEGIVPLLKSIINILLWFVAFIFILQFWGVSMTAFLAGLGVAGVVLGIAFKDSFSNIFAGISLIIDDSFRKGELIELPDGEKGYVLETNLRSTKIRNFDGEIVIIPNSVLANMRFRNYARPNTHIRGKVNILVAYGSDLEKVEKLMIELLLDKDGVLNYPKPTITFTKMTENYLEMELKFFISDYNHIHMEQMKSDIMKEAYRALLENNVKIPSTKSLPEMHLKYKNVDKKKRKQK
jgi:MscS family membrane protein